MRPNSSTLRSSAQLGLVEDDVADERVPVGVKSGRRHRDDRVTLTDTVRAEQPVGLDHARTGTGDIEVIGSEQSRVFGGLAADQGAARQDTALGDALHDGRDTLGVHLADADVVGHEERLCAADDQVVDDHADEVVTDGVVHTHLAGEVDLRADAVGGGGEERTLVTLERRGVEEAA